LLFLHRLHWSFCILPLEGPRYIRFDSLKQFNVPVAHIATLSITILACLDKCARYDDFLVPISRTPRIANYVFATPSGGRHSLDEEHLWYCRSFNFAFHYMRIHCVRDPRAKHLETAEEQTNHKTVYIIRGDKSYYKTPYNALPVSMCSFSFSFSCSFSFSSKGCSTKTETLPGWIAEASESNRC
jgi:hypothetical protein